MENNSSYKLQTKFSNFLTSNAFVGIGLITLGSIAFVLKKLNVFSKLLYKVDQHSSKHGGDVVAKVLKSHDVDYMFTLAGGHISPILVAAEKLGIKVIDTRHEANAVFAADASARLTGKVGIVAVTAGPGLTNTITAIKNAQMAESPVLLLGGAAATLLKGRGALQDIDQMSLFKSLCKFTATVGTVREIAPTLQKAIQQAQSGTPGPVFVEFPLDVLYPYHIVKKEAGLKTPKTFRQRLINWYLENHIHNIFGGGFDERIPTSPLKPIIPKASSRHVTKSAEMLSRAKRPLILVGSQAMLPPISAQQTCSNLEKLGVPCFLGGMARGLLGKSNPLHMRQKRGEALKDADLVVLAGAICDFRLGYGRSLNPKAKIIAVNRDKSQLYKNAGVFWNPTLAIQSDVGSFLNDLATALPNFKVDPEWIQSLRERDNQKEDINRKMAEGLPDQHLNPLKVLQDFEKSLPDNTIIVADGGDFVATAAYTLRPRGPLTWLDPGAFGTLGVGGGFALGAKMARPDAHVVIVYGDGSLGYSIMEFDTFFRHKLPILALVGNDASWMQIERDQTRILGSNVACQLAFSNYHKMAEGLEAKGFLLKAEDRDNLSKVFEEAHKILKQDGHSVLINALIGRTTFREGSLSV